MIFSLRIKQVLPAVAMLSFIIANHGIHALDKDMDLVSSSMNNNEGGLRRKEEIGDAVSIENGRKVEEIGDAVGAPPQPRFPPDAAIIGGSPVDVDEYPWFARATLRNFFGTSWYGCGGMLVTPEFILTAAHCEFGNNGGQTVGFQVGALCEPFGPSSGNNCGQKVESFDAVEVFDHPNYNSVNSNNDFSLIKLDGRSTITPVPMDSEAVSETYPEDKPLYPIGVGTTQSGSSVFPDRLLDVETKYVSNSKCQNKYSIFGTITSNMMCSGDLVNGGEDACQGDSGGPLYDKDNDLLVGITSWGIGCALRGFPGVYARVSAQWDDFIKPTICDNHSSPKPDFCGGGPPSSCGPSEDTIEIEVLTDGDGGDIAFGVQQRKASGRGWNTILGPIGEYEGSGTPLASDTLYEETICVPRDECFRFGIADSAGDGMSGEGYYKVLLNGSTVVDKSLNDELDVKKFGSC